MTAAQLIERAYSVVLRRGHSRGAGLGTPASGFTLAGAIYLAAGFYGGREELVDPRICPAHRPGRGGECQQACEYPLWVQCNVAFAWLAEAATTGRDESLRLDRVVPTARDFDMARIAGETGAALWLLGRVLWALGIPPVRPTVGVA
ncbi:hypothetical protein E1091_01270 [Micromonospora fluostatini]|uniref:Uncharacterized protein n=1 Tax=Micromonospora fluostatini TaxID=1629071 RepID=A0ABY2DLM9_9ACTN|nr:hypothetical protein E1091_01270 [Micromonospora fluostatini]